MMVARLRSLEATEKKWSILGVKTEQFPIL